MLRENIGRNESLSCSPTRDEALTLITWPGGSQINEEALGAGGQNSSHLVSPDMRHTLGVKVKIMTWQHFTAPIITQRWQLTVSAHRNPKKENSRMRQVPDSNQTALSEKQLDLPCSGELEPTYQRKGKLD